MEIKEHSRGMRLLKAGHRGAIRVLFSRTGVVTLALMIQIGFLAVQGLKFQEFVPQVLWGKTAFLAVMVLVIINSGMGSNSKITWLTIVMVLPVFGGLLYLYTYSDIGHRALRQMVRRAQEQCTPPQCQQGMQALAEKNTALWQLACYLHGRGGAGVYQNTRVTYFASGEQKFEAMLDKLREAKRNIYLEYFIVEEGEMWGNVLQILAQKAAEGVEIKMMYDGGCEFSTLPHSYPKKLAKLGIHCRVFSPVRPFVSTHYNYRDHRKRLVIDNKIAFTGGVNLADEYINQKVRFGHWKDTAIMLEGEAAIGFADLFLQMWNVGQHSPQCPIAPPKQETQGADDGFVIPYGDSPLDEDRVGERVYMSILENAKEYVYIMTPYLILDEVMETALCFAAERGVDVRIMLPGIPDKKLPYALAKTHYRRLINSGIKIYEYTPGFLHAKCFVSDDDVAVVGSINLDYRSLYHHFECAALMYGCRCVGDIKADFLATQAACRPVTANVARHRPFVQRLLGSLLKLIAPLM